MKNELVPSHPLELSEKNVSTILNVTFFTLTVDFNLVLWFIGLFCAPARKVEEGFAFSKVKVCNSSNVLFVHCWQLYLTIKLLLVTLSM